jgi:hypothetical protein|tara:strand:- start:4112 stop:4462 length:351 start_codon:yes stop_codon:yes gene_type:complete
MLQPHIASLIHSISLIALGSFGYFNSDNPSVTALIPVVFGILLIAMNKGVKNQNKLVAHIAVTLTLLIILGLLKPLQGALGREDYAAFIRVLVMLGTGIFAMITFIKSFVAARKAR